MASAVSERRLKGPTFAFGCASVARACGHDDAKGNTYSVCVHECGALEMGGKGVGGGQVKLST
jgi:hypothetical protein